MHKRSKALVKAMLTSPSQDSNGFSNTFTSTDFSSLKQMGNKRSEAARVANMLCSADEFMQAYGSRISGADAKKAMNTFECRCCMFVHGKTHPTRATFDSIAEIAAAWYAHIKELDPLIPKWAKMPQPVGTPKVKSVPKVKRDNVVLRETDSTIDEALLSEMGFVIDKDVIQTSTNHVYKLSALNSDGIHATLTLVAASSKKVKGQKAPDNTVEVDRSDLLAGELWHPDQMPESTFLDCSKLALVADGFEFRSSVLLGEIKARLAQEAEKSDDDKMKLQVKPNVGVVSKQKFNKGAMKLFAISNSIQIIPDEKATNLALASNRVLLYSGQGFKVVMTSSNDSVFKDVEVHTVCFYWHVQASHDRGITNCTFETKKIDVSALDLKISLTIPYITNCAAIKEGDTLKVVRQSEAEISEPATKKFKFTMAKAKPKAK